MVMNVDFLVRMGIHLGHAVGMGQCILKIYTTYLSLEQRLMVLTGSMVGRISSISKIYRILLREKMSVMEVKVAAVLRKLSIPTVRVRLLLCQSFIVST